MDVFNKFNKKYGQSKDVILPPPMSEDEEVDVTIPSESNILPSNIEDSDPEAYKDRFYYYEEPEEITPEQIAPTVRPGKLSKILDQEIAEEDESKSSDDLLKKCTAFYKLATR